MSAAPRPAHGPVIAVDALGGDHAPAAVVEGAIAAARDGRRVALVGPRSRLADELDRLRAADLGMTIVDALETIGMDESPVAALRRKPRASIRVAAEIVARGDADAWFTAGHSGAALVAAHAALGLLPGVERPALAVTVPTARGSAVLIDAGANSECRPSHLRQFGLMGAAFARAALGLSDPRVGLLSIGEEAGKGNELTREAHALLASAPLTFIGNVEAREIFAGHAEVIVCDGFTGNVALKVGEGVVDLLERVLREQLGPVLETSPAIQDALARFRRRVDATESGAAPLLGVSGLTLIGHGRSTPRAIRNGIDMAARLVEAGVQEKLTALLQSSSRT
jgi:glycerol-3-phosphate acyltransferase PlsX